MKKLNIVLVFFSLLLSIAAYSQAKNESSSTITGHVISSEGEHIPFATVHLKGTTIGVVCDESGHFKIDDLPLGNFVLIARYTGFKAKEKEISIIKNTNQEVYFSLTPDVFGLDEVVVTGNRSETNRKESGTIVNVISPKLLSSTQSNNLRESLDFAPGLRTESNCQNCGFSQVRMNGLEGPYSQILINSRAIFSGLAGVYGLELIPSNMIEKVEIIRGGGSALYGSNAIGGTINLIMKDPITNSYEVGISGGLTGFGLGKNISAANDNLLTFNTSIVSENSKTGMAIFGYMRNKDPFDANADGFSEHTSIKNTSFGLRLFHRLNSKNKLSLDFFNINEYRRGGNKHDLLPHLTDITELADHSINSGAITYDRFMRKGEKFSAFISGQNVDRDTYYGAEKSLSDYGNTKDLSYVFGAQYKIIKKKYNFIAGIENQGSTLVDRKFGYPDIDNGSIDFSDSSFSFDYTENSLVSDQFINMFGTFAQWEQDFKKLQISAGLRFDNYMIIDKSESAESKSGNVLSPRLTAKYDIRDNLQARFSYSQGFRAPQIFDEDLHIESSGARKVLHRNSPDLTQESSKSYMFSLDFSKEYKKSAFTVLLEGFYTQLENAFVNEYGDIDENGIIIYTRVNSEEVSVIQGINMEFNYAPNYDISFTGGFTVQKSVYGDLQEFDSKRFFRTPSDYGYFVFDWDASKKLSISATANYTGKMLVPYFGPTLDNPEDGELRETERFYDFGAKVSYKIKLKSSTMQIYAGVKNIFNSYQNDFDSGIERDPGYVYGPINPRTIYIGLKFGNMLY
jgi:outer membrane receptor for ferrienterochelin and colicins